MTHRTQLLQFARIDRAEAERNLRNVPDPHRSLAGYLRGRAAAMADLEALLLSSDKGAGTGSGPVGDPPRGPRPPDSRDREWFGVTDSAPSPKLVAYEQLAVKERDRAIAAEQKLAHVQVRLDDLTRKWQDMSDRNPGRAVIAARAAAHAVQAAARPDRG